MQLAFPQLTQQIRSCRCHPALARCVEKAATVSSSILFYVSPIPDFFSQLRSPIKLPSCPLHQPPSLSQSREQEPATTIPTPPVAWRRRWWWVSSRFNFFPIPYFSDNIFQVKLLLSQPRRPPSLSQSREQEHTTTIPVLPVAWRRWSRRVFLLFLIFPHHSNFFLTACFPVKLLFCRPHQPPSLSQSMEQLPITTIPTGKLCGEVGDDEFSSCFCFTSLFNFFSDSLNFQVNCYSAVATFCCFSFSFLPLHLNFMMFYVPIKICLPALTFCFVK